MALNRIRSARAFRRARETSGLLIRWISSRLEAQICTKWGWVCRAIDCQLMRPTNSTRLTISYSTGSMVNQIIWYARSTKVAMTSSTQHSSMASTNHVKALISTSSKLRRRVIELAWATTCPSSRVAKATACTITYRICDAVISHIPTSMAFTSLSLRTLSTNPPRTVYRWLTERSLRKMQQPIRLRASRDLESALITSRTLPWPSHTRSSLASRLAANGRDSRISVPRLSSKLQRVI